MLLEESISKLNANNESKVKKLKNVCRTRWVKRIKGLTEFIDLFPSVFHCIERMSSNIDMITSNENASKASNRLRAIVS